MPPPGLQLPLWSPSTRWLARLSPMALSFLAENRRSATAAIRDWLPARYPSYRQLSRRLAESSAVSVTKSELRYRRQSGLAGPPRTDHQGFRVQDCSVRAMGIAGNDTKSIATQPVAARSEAEKH